MRRILRQEGKPVRVEELSVYFADPESEDFRTRLVQEGFRLVVPLVYRDRLMGVLALKEKLSGERFDRDDEALLSTLANQSALAIETALLHDEMTRQAELKRDLEIARDIQTSLLPRSLPDRRRVLLLRREPARRRWSAATSTTSSHSRTTTGSASSSGTCRASPSRPRS